MVAYSFQKQFVPFIECGLKAQTIRADRKRHARPGETLQLYFGMRTKHCRLIGTAICFSIQPIVIDLREAMISGQSGNSLTTIAELDAFARRDGFDDWMAMRLFWSNHHPKILAFTGMLIRWTDFHPGGGSGEML